MIESLPDELMGEIFRWVVHESSNAIYVLSRLCLVSVKFRRVVEEVCFGRVELVGNLNMSLYGSLAHRMAPREKPSYYDWVTSLSRRIKPRVVHTINLMGTLVPEEFALGELLLAQTDVKVLDLGWTNTSRVQLDDIRHGTNLDRLLLNNARFDDFKVDFAYCLPQHLKELNLSWVSCVDDTALNSIACHLKSLEILLLRGCECVTGTGLLHLLDFTCRFRKRLRKLNISFSRVDDSSMLALADGLSALEIMVLSSKTDNIWGSGTWSMNTVDRIAASHGHRLTIQLEAA